MMKMLGKLHVAEKVRSKTVMDSYSNNIWYMIPFTLVKKITNIVALESALSHKLHKHSHYAGCGYSLNVNAIHMTSPVTGWVELAEYNGIGD
jgi:hypothetical protein